MRQLSNFSACRNFFALQAQFGEGRGFWVLGELLTPPPPPIPQQVLATLFFIFFFFPLCFSVLPRWGGGKFLCSSQSTKATFYKGLVRGSTVWRLDLCFLREKGLSPKQRDLPAAPLPGLRPSCPPLKWRATIIFPLSNPKHLRTRLAAEATGIADLFRQRGIRKLQSPGHRLDDLQAIISQQISFG